MKKSLLALIISAFSLTATANDCKLIVPFTPGGSTDIYANALKKGNSQFFIDYKPGAFSALATSHINQNKDQFFMATPSMYSASNPNKSPDIDLLQILFGIDLAIVTGKQATLDDLLTKKVSIGVPNIGQAQHLIALQLQEKNPLIVIVPTGGDTKAIQLLVNKEIDAYVSSSIIANKWLGDFNTLSNITTVPFNKPVTRNNVTLHNLNFVGIFVSKDLSDSQKDHISKCINTSTASSEYKSAISEIGISPLNATGLEKDKLLAAHIKWLRKHDH